MLFYHALSILRCLKALRASHIASRIGVNIFFLLIMYFTKPFGLLGSIVKKIHSALVWLSINLTNILLIAVQNLFGNNSNFLTDNSATIAIESGMRAF